MYDYARGDFSGPPNALCSVNLTSVMDEGDLESPWQTWKDLFFCCSKGLYPYQAFKGRNPVPWLTGAIINLIKKKETVRRKLKSHPSESPKIKFQTLRSQVKHAIREDRDEFFNTANIDFKSNPKRLWSVLRTSSKLRNIPESVSMATDIPHTTAATQNKIADLFNNYLTSVLSTCQSEKEGRSLEQRPTIQSVINDIVLHVSEVEAVLKSLDPNKAASPDEIPARILKKTAATIAPSLCTLFNISLEEGYIPRE